MTTEINVTLPRPIRWPSATVAAWIAAVALFGVGDIVTTFIGLELLGAVEYNALPREVIGAAGVLALIPLKAVAFAVFALMYRVTPDAIPLERLDALPLDTSEPLPMKPIGIPLGLAGFGAVVVAWNTRILLILAGVL